MHYLKSKTWLMWGGLLWLLSSFHAAIAQEPYVAQASASSALSGFQLSAEQLAWLKFHPQILVGTMDAWPPMDYLDSNGEPRGIGARLIEALNKRLGNAITIVPGSWQSIYERGRDGELDAILDLTPRPEREKDFLFTQPYVEVPHSIFARKNKSGLRSLNDLQGYSVGVEQGFYLADVLKRDYPGIKVRVYPATGDALDAVSKGEVDAYIGNRAVANYIIERELISNLKQYGKISETASVNVIGVNKESPELRDILQKSLNNLTHEEWRQILRGWIDESDQIEQPLFTEQERQWLLQQPQITVGAMDTWPPFDFVDQQGNPSGIGADLVAAINARMEGKLRIVSGSWDDLYAQVVNKKLDAILDITPKPERAKDFLFTRPYLDVPHVIVAPRNVPFIANEDNLKGKILALEKGFGNVRYFRENFPQVQVREYRDTSYALDAVVRGEADAYAGNRGVALYLIERELMTNLKIHGRLRKSGSVLAIGTRKDANTLAVMLQKSLDNISEAEYQSIYSKWNDPQQNLTSQIELNLNDRLWLQQHPSISIAFDENYPPYSFRNERGQMVGMAVDLAREVARRIGVELVVDRGSKWNSLFTAAQQKEIDAVGTMIRTLEREKWFAFSRPYISLAQYIVTTQKRIGEFPSTFSLTGKKVALVDGYAISQQVVQEVDGIDAVYFPTQLEAMQAVAQGLADATVTSIGVAQHLINKESMDSLGIAGLFSQGKVELRIAVRKDWPQLASLLNKGIESLSKDEIATIYSRWTSLEAAYAELVDSDSKLGLTYEERQWLSQHPIIRTASDPNWAPIEFVENGEYKGISNDYLKKMEELLGIRFEHASPQLWPEVLKSYQRKEIDMITGMYATPQRRSNFLFTDSYASFLIAVFSGPELNYIDNLDELNQRKVVVVEEYSIQHLLEQDYPEIELITARDTKDALLKLVRGEAEAYVDNILVTSYYIGKLGLSQIRVVGETPYRSDQRIGVRTDWPELVSIMNKALAAITDQEKGDIYNKWVRVGYEYGFDYDLFWKILVVVFIAFLIFFYWNRKLSRLNQQLIEANFIEEQTRMDLEEANRQLQAMDRLKSMFIASMSHELRTPLNSIIGFSGLMLQGITGALNDKQQDSIQRINKAGNHLLSLITDVIDISKIEAGRIDSVIEKFSLQDVIEEAIESIRPQLDQKGLTLRLRANQWGDVQTDRKRLLQCLLNYLSNAVKFTEQGSIMVSVYFRGNRVEVSVTDTGIGIPREDIPKLFEAFERLDSRLRVKAGGTGLGLYLTRKIAQEILQGDVSVTSKENRGSTFRLEFAASIGPKTEVSGEKTGE